MAFRHQIAADDIVPDALPRVLLRDGLIAPDGTAHTVGGVTLSWPLGPECRALTLEVAVTPGT